ncbi:hypothetical protein M9Y10_028416 [Tritrichomonas musculus]|uniref:Uncharacterized protein n=1 Tax=Tritrichomonas musculus TaxID=1915356 RepID=A0ABR2KJ94_9EUKA
MNIDWKSISSENIEDLRPIPWAYCQALINLKLWDKYCDAFYDDSLFEYIVGTLLKSSVRKNLLKNMEEEKIIHLLDTTNPLIRRHLLNILIEQSDQCPVSIAVGENLLTNISQHLWGYECTSEIFSLQSYDTLRNAFRSRVKPQHAKTPLMLWKYATDPSNSYIVKTKPSNNNENDNNQNKNCPYLQKSKFTYLTPSNFANARQLKKRTNFGNFIAEIYIEGLEALKSNNNEHIEDEKYFNFVYQPFHSIFVGFQDVWIQNKDVYKKVREALLAFPFHLTKFTPISQFMTDLSPANNYFNFTYFIKHRILNNDDIIFNILPASLEEDFKKPLRETKHVSKFIFRLISITNNQVINFYRSLQATSMSQTLKNDKTNDYNKLAFIWPKLLQYYEDYVLNAFERNEAYQLSYLIRQINEENIDSLTKISETLSLPFDYSMGIFNKIINNTLDNKDSIVSNSSLNYQRKINNIFTAMITPFSWKNSISISDQIKYTPFFKFLDANTRDKILIDFICDPSGKYISNEISNDAPTTLLALCLIFDDLKKITQILSRTKDDQSDEYGFIKDVSINFPASLTQKSRKVEEYKGTLHLFEKKIIPLLRHKQVSIANNAYILYIKFVEKLFYFAIKLNDKNFYKLACDCHFRLCRFLNANTSQEIQQFVINKFIEQVCNPLSLYVGIKAHESENSDGSEEYAADLYDDLIVKFPFSIEKTGLTMFPIIVQILLSSKHPKLPGIGKIGSIIVEKLMNRLFNEIPATFNIPSNYASSVLSSYSFYSYFKQLEESDVLKNENVINGIKLLQNERGKLILPDLLVKKFLKNAAIKVSKLNVSASSLYLFVDPALVDNQFFAKSKSSKITPAIEPFLKFIEILSEKINSYNSENYEHPTTSLINQFKSLIFANNRGSYSNLCYGELSIKHQLPQSVVEQFDQIRKSYSTKDSNILSDSLSSYTQKLHNFDTDFVLTNKTINFIKAIFKDDIDQNFLLELISSESFDYDVLTTISQFVPLTKQQERQIKKNGEEPDKQPLTFNIHVYYQTNLAYEYFLKIKDLRPPAKPKKCTLCGKVLTQQSTQNKKKNSPSSENISWKDVVSWNIIKPILGFDPETFCEALKTNGYGLFNYVKILYKQLTKNNLDINLESKTVKLINNGEKGGQFTPINFNLVAHLLNLCFKDILIEDPEPTKENPNPKPTPTLFSDEKGFIKYTLEPFSDKNSNASNGNKLQGDKKFFSTKVLISYLASILSLPITIGHVDLTIFTSSLIEILSMFPSDLKKVIGDDNYSYYIDHLVTMLITHISFGKDIKDKEWAKKFESPLYEAFFRLFTSDAMHHISLEIVNKKLQTLCNNDEKNAIVSSFVSILSSTELNYTLHTRTRTVAWCVDPRYVGSQLPSYCIEFMDSLASDEKCHIDVKKTIAAGIVAFFKSQALIRSNPTSQFKELFEILKKLYSKSKLLMTPFFCQLLRPKFCFALASTSTAYSSIMPTKSLPEALLTSLPFGLISMPRDDRFEDDKTEVNDKDAPKSWKDAHDMFLAAFIGNSLLLKEENVLQLVIQVLTKVQARGGRTAEMIAKFIISLLSEPNILRLSSILINFIFSFCLQDPHKGFEKLVDSFISIFKRLRECIDIVNDKQAPNFWIDQYNFKASNYELIEQTCNSFIMSFESVISNLKDQADMQNAHEIAKRIVEVMDGSNHPKLFISPFFKLRNLFSFISDDDLLKPLLSLYSSSETNEEENLSCLLKFLRKNALTIGDDTLYPSFIKDAFKKNINGLSVKVMKEICEWPLELCQNKKVIDLICPLIASFKKYILKPASTSSTELSDDLKEILDKLWAFGKSEYSQYQPYQAMSDSLSYVYGSPINQNLPSVTETQILNSIKEKRKPKTSKRRGRR